MMSLWTLKDTFKENEYENHEEIFVCYRPSMDRHS